MYEDDGFYSDLMWCPRCKTTVRFLWSPDASYCADCGAKVRWPGAIQLESAAGTGKKRGRRKRD